MAKKKKKQASYKKTQQKRKTKSVLRKKRRTAVKHTNHASQFIPTPTGISLANRQIKESSTYPVHEIRISNNWKENGLASIYLTKKHHSSTSSACIWST